MLSKENVPGPGQYGAKTQNKSGPAYSMGIKPNGGSKMETPGPGHVTVQQNWQTDKPGQGGWLALDNSKDNTRGKEMVKSGKVPGPGAYHVQSANSLAYSVRPRHAVKVTQFTPGPGAYQPKLPQERSRI